MLFNIVGEIRSHILLCRLTFDCGRFFFSLQNVNKVPEKVTKTLPKKMHNNCIEDCERAEHSERHRENQIKCHKIRQEYIRQILGMST